MTPELLNLLTPEEAKAWALCESCGPYADMGDDGTFAGEVRRCSDFALVHQDCDDSNARKFIAEASVALPLALTTIATLRADLAEVQARYGRAWEALCTIGDAVDKAGHYTLIPERALHAGNAVNALIDEADELRAENTTLRETLAEQQRAFVIGLDLAQRTADAEIAELRATLANDRGEGEPPSEGWKRNTTGDGMWERILAMRPSWTSEQEGEPTDTLIVGRDDDVHWRWERYVDNGAGQRLGGGVGGIECARTAMRAADDAVKGAT